MTAMLLAISLSGAGPSNHAPLPRGVIGRSGSTLSLNGLPYTFTGVNAYELATDWGSNFGCGGDVFDLGAFFSSLRPNSLVRFAAFQQQATNYKTGKRDWTGLDRVFAAAAAHHQRLIPVIASNWQPCDGVDKSTGWYAGGYRTDVQPDPNGAAQPTTYWTYLAQFALRYRSSPALGLWEPIGEPEVACGSVAVLRTFFDEVGGELHALDPSHLVDSGTLSDEQCGLQNGDYGTVTASPGVDVASYHDYGSPTIAMPVSLKRVVAIARSLDKPIAVFEGGIYAGGIGAGCTTPAGRAKLYRAKMQAWFAAGVAGFLPWNWQPLAGSSPCDYAMIADDPTMALLHSYHLPSGTRAADSPAGAAPTRAAHLVRGPSGP